MKKLLLLLTLSLGLLSAFGQMTNWRGEFHLQYVMLYDYDLDRRTTQPHSTNTTVVIDIDSYGTGRLVIYAFDEKNILSIQKANYDGKQITMTCTSEAGASLNIYGVCQNNACLQGLIMDDAHNNTATVFFNDGWSGNWSRK